MINTKKTIKPKIMERTVKTLNVKFLGLSLLSGTIRKEYVFIFLFTRAILRIIYPGFDQITRPVYLNPPANKTLPQLYRLLFLDG